MTPAGSGRAHGVSFIVKVEGAASVAGRWAAYFTNMNEQPDMIAIDHDDYHASHVGRRADGSQFFLTTPFVPAIGSKMGREFIALYLFDAEGRFQEARIDDLSTRAELDQERSRRVFEQRVTELGEVEYCRIEVQLFQVERFGITFGLVPRPPEDDGDGCGLRHGRATTWPFKRRGTAGSMTLELKQRGSTMR